MWLTPCSRSTSRARAASPFETRPSAAAPKTTRLDSCPVAPNGARSIMTPTLGPTPAFHEPATPRRPPEFGQVTAGSRPRRQLPAVRKPGAFAFLRGLDLRFRGSYVPALPGLVTQVTFR